MPPISVAPRAGAWIETCRYLKSARRVRVAPRAGAWIETSHQAQLPRICPSRPARARGLKHLDVEQHYGRPGRRAPRGRVD